ncbi:MAG: neutral zinc metallopeptidase [Pseudomonadota bacterium]
MKWRGYRRSSNVQYRKGGRGRGMAVGGGLGIGGLIIVGLISMFTGLDFRTVMSGAELVTGSRTGGGAVQETVTTEASNEMEAFIGAVTAQTEDTWNVLFQQQVGRPYEAPQVVVFENATRSACGGAQAAMGPHYCPADKTIYMDLTFFEKLRTRYGAPGDFAIAYVVAHEVGHHIENLLGILPQVQAQQRQLSLVGSNDLSVRVELMADCLAGIWARANDQLNDVLEPGDIQEALQAAAAVGDDTLQQRSQGRVVPDSFTHGTSDQRQRWFTTGFETGAIDACNTFEVARL